MPYDESNEDEHKDFGSEDTAPVQDIVRPARPAPTISHSTNEVTDTPAQNLSTVKQPKTARSGRRIARLGAEVLLVIAVIFLAIQYVNLRSDKQSLNEQLISAQNNPQALVQKQSQAIIDKVGALMELPANETPTVAAVSDAAAARTQSNFFANAQNGDKVLMYVKAGQAILYRPSTNKVILVAPLTFSNQAATGATTKTTP